MTILARLRNWLRPYPDDAELQREVVRVTKSHQAWLVRNRDLTRIIRRGREAFLRTADYVRIFNNMAERMNVASSFIGDHK